MTHYTLGQLEQLWVKNGGNRGWAPLMAAVAIAESRGNPTAAYNTTTHLGGQTKNGNPGRQGATGLWQLEWPLWARAAGATSRTQLYTPNLNARLAVKAWNTSLGTSNWYTPSNPTNRDPIIAKWKKTGSPRHPSELQVLKWLGQLGLENTATGAGPTAPSPALGEPTTAANARAQKEKTSQCVWSVGGFLGGCILNRGQVRALKGGLLVIAGGVIVFGGVLLLAAVGFGSKPAQRQLQRVGLGRRTGPINIAGASASSSSAIHFNLFSTGTTTAPAASTPSSQPALGSGRDYIDVTAVTTALPSGSRALPSGRAALPRGRERRPRAKGA